MNLMLWARWNRSNPHRIAAPFLLVLAVTTSSGCTDKPSFEDFAEQEFDRARGSLDRLAEMALAGKYSSVDTFGDSDIRVAEIGMESGFRFVHDAYQWRAHFDKSLVGSLWLRGDGIAFDIDASRYPILPREVEPGVGIVLLAYIYVIDPESLSDNDAPPPCSAERRSLGIGDCAIRLDERWYLVADWDDSV